MKRYMKNGTSILDIMTDDFIVITLVWVKCHGPAGKARWLITGFINICLVARLCAIIVYNTLM